MSHSDFHCFDLKHSNLKYAAVQGIGLGSGAFLLSRPSICSCLSVSMHSESFPPTLTQSLALGFVLANEKTAALNKGLALITLGPCNGLSCMLPKFTG